MEQLVQPVVSPNEQVQLSPEGLSEKTAAFTLFQPAAQNRFVAGPTAATVCADAVGFAATAAATSCSSPPSWSYMTELSNT